MTEIKVILDTKQGDDLSVLSPEERAHLFDNLAKENPDIPRAVVDSFIAIQSDISNDNVRFSRPELKELLLRKIIQLSSGYGSNFNTIVIPIVAGFAAASISASTSKYSKKSNADHTQGDIAGGARPQVGGPRPPARTERAKELGPDAIKIQFDAQIVAVTTHGQNYIAPPNEELIVVGLFVNPICAVVQTLSQRAGDMFEPMTAVAIETSRLDARLGSGRYTYIDASRSCESYFHKPNYDIDINGTPTNETVKVVFADVKPDQLHLIFITIYNYIVNTEQYHKSAAAAQNIHTHIDTALSAAVSDAKSSGPMSAALATILLPQVYPPIEISGIELPRPAILNTLETIHFGKFCTVFSRAVLADIDIRGFSRIYQSAAIKGKDSREVVDEIQLYKDKQSRAIFQASIKKKLIEEQNKLNIYYMIISKKLGVVRLGEIERQVQLRPSIIIEASGVLKLLSAAERKPIEIEYERRQKYIDAVINNKCPHVKLYRQFRRAFNDSQTSKLFGELKQFFKNANEQETMITCRSCGFDIMCPHVRDFVTLDLAGKYQAEIKAKLTKYIDRGASRDQYFCKICGELMSVVVLGDVGQGLGASMNEELKNFMWGEIASLTKYLKFGGLVDISRLITSTRDACYPFIFEIEKQILKSKTNSADEIKAKKRLYVTIYAFAYFVHLISSNSVRSRRIDDNDITFRNFTVRREAKNAVVDMIKYVLDTILLSRNIIIREIPGMSPDVIKQSLITAYKSIQSTGTLTIVHSSESNNMLITLLLDPVYKYLYAVNTVDDVINGKRAPKPNKKFDIVDRVDDIIGQPLASVVKDGDVFAKARVPKFKGWHEDTFLQLKPMRAGKLTVGGDSTKLIYDTAFPGYCAQSFKLFMQKLSARIYMEPMYIDVSAGAKGDPSSPMDVKFRPVFESLYKKYQDFAVHETILLLYRTMGDAQGYTFLPAEQTRRWVGRNVALSRLYDEDGAAHKWDVFVTGGLAGSDVKGADAPHKEVKNSDVIAMLEKGERFTDIIIDRRCSVCGALRSVVSGLSEIKIHDSLQARQRVNNFFRFYESRCPKGGLHEFGVEQSAPAPKDVEGDIDKCQKCNLSNAFLLNTTSALALNYYREYRDIYLRERRELADLNDITLLAAPAIQTALVMQDFTEEYSAWSTNFNVVLDLANKLKINHKLLSALGAIEKQEYTDVQSGAYIPPEVEERNSTRSYMVDTHIKNLITEYNQLKAFHKLTKPSAELSAVVDASGINKHKIAELAEHLPSIYNNYSARFAYFQQHKKSREIVAFGVQSFCEMCLLIWEGSNKETEKLRHGFVNYIVKKILRNEELFTKPGYFNWSLLYGDKEKSTEQRDTNLSTEANVSDQEDEVEKDDDFGDTATPMVAADLDIDVDPDRDPADDEDTEQDWKVGEELGL